MQYSLAQTTNESLLKANPSGTKRWEAGLN